MNEVMKTINIFLLASNIFLIALSANSQTWDPLGQGTDGPVYTMHNDGLGLIVGGNFNSAGGVYGTRFLAKWRFEFQNWSTYGTPSIFTGAVFSIADFGGLIVAAGDFPSPGGLSRIVKEGGTGGWTSLGSGTTDGIIWNVFAFEDKLYAGGSFNQIAGVPANKIAEWNGTSWHAMGSGTTGTVLAITGDTSGIYAGGSFLTAGGVTVNNIAKWNGVFWSALGEGLPNAVQSLYLRPDGSLLAGGAPIVQRWTGANWFPVGSTDTASAVFTISAKTGNIFAGGNFNINGLIPSNIAYFSNNWLNVGSMNDYVRDICEDGGVFAAGNFTIAGGTPVNHIAKLVSFNIVQYRINLNKPILDNQRVIDTLSIPRDNLTENYIIADLNLTIDTVFHTNDDDLELILTHDGIRDTVIFRAGGSGDNFIRTVLNDSASTPVGNGSAPFTGQFRPFRNLSQFNGTEAGGEWMLEIYDRATGNTGIFDAWSLEFKFQQAPISIRPISSSLPSGYSLYQNYPNPFNPKTVIRFQLAVSGFTDFKVYDILGREIAVIVYENLNPGIYEVQWNAENFPSGVYFYRIKADNYTETKKMILIK